VVGGLVVECLLGKQGSKPTGPAGEVEELEAPVVLEHRGQELDGGVQGPLDQEPLPAVAQAAGQAPLELPSVGLGLEGI